MISPVFQRIIPTIYILNIFLNNNYDYCLFLFFCIKTKKRLKNTVFSRFPILFNYLDQSFLRKQFFHFFLHFLSLCAGSCSIIRFGRCINNLPGRIYQNTASIV